MESGARRITLPNGLFAFVSAQDYDGVAKHKWYGCRAKSGKIYVHGTVNGKPILLHRFILRPADDEKIDHRDLDPLNCTRSNLRLATHSQNLANQKARDGSGYKGVHWRIPNGPYQVHIGHQGKKIIVGYFKKAENAARAYDAKARELFGPFARLNFPEDGEACAR